MTLRNTANDGYFNVLIALVRVLLTFGPMSRGDLVAFCQASSKVDATRLRQTLLRWTELGLFCENDDSILLADGISLSSDASAVVAALPHVLRRLVFREENNARFWEQEGSRCADLTRGLAWLLAQDVYKNISKHAEFEALESSQLAASGYGGTVVQNSTRWQGLLVWGHYLGFLWSIDPPLIDPTTALRQDLHLIFGKNAVLTVADLENRVAVVLPVLDKGCYRKEVEEVLNPAYWQRPTGPDQLSTSLSRALWRLIDQGVLGVESRSDAGDNRILQRGAGQSWQRFTHVRLIGEVV